MSTIERAQRHAPATQEAALPLVSVVIPCLNEAENIEECVTRARAVLEEHGLDGEVVVADNGSTDGSPELAAAAGARVIHEERRGYGSAYLAGFAAARGEYIVMLDADLTYDFDADPAVRRASWPAAPSSSWATGWTTSSPARCRGCTGTSATRSSPGILNLFFRTGVRDAHCGMRGLRRDILPKLDLRTPGMEFASEMVIRASKEKLRIAEFPISTTRAAASPSCRASGTAGATCASCSSTARRTSSSGRASSSRRSACSSWRPCSAAWTSSAASWYLHSMIAGSLLLDRRRRRSSSLGLCAHAYGMYFMGDRDPWFDRMRSRFRLEHGLAARRVHHPAGPDGRARSIFAIWVDRGFGSLSEESLAVLGATLIIVGVQVFFSSFLLSILGLRRQAQ